ncbi:MAG: LptF/LptG family permease [Saprospiraceae bacterium]|uniref:LptF/LptG family permease n=1 Tax=Candidatus Brachybacter algidus TaxID=2982024 RepID=UPI001B4DE41C|nr:LptF/LptG family permease [Candidatus Brachybacter algidus]MBP7538375.1 LptF/LptG family permease [Saprospiraceae bacterium]MBK6372178.1 LptF/LptG family permease [Candidatus Brachybacter algidus]MBK6447572.1 LptF/LptG family permease [Candidatus Brachybacter algidus]MBK7603410.1 LptF/LptG family permease [Candidatus Brachybacter algidus]MBK8356819.1 LptF/LptG family permease [Candidatus Brachybacter algidus]
MANPLKILDQFIIKKYLTTFFFTAFIFTMIAVVIDTSDKLEKFLREPCTLHEIIFQYYGAFIPHINWLLWPLFSLISVIFFTSRMATNSEVISILNAGVSYNRFLRPYFISAGLLCFFHALGNHIFIPMLNKNRIEFEAKYIKKVSDKNQNNDVHLMLNQDDKVFVRFYNRSDSMARDLRIERFKNGQLTEEYKAREAKFTGDSNIWQLVGIEQHLFNGLDEKLFIKPRDTVRMKLNLTPDDFFTIRNYKETLTTPKLLKFIAKEESRGTGVAGEYRIEFHRRTADSATLFILMLIGVSVASRKVRGGMGLNLAVGVSLGASYMILSRFSVTFALSNLIPPMLGVWIPNLLFIGVSLWLITRAQK